MDHLSARTRVYTVADGRYFLGAVALYNSLRLTGNSMPVAIVDAGLTPGQRAMLMPHVDLVEGPRDRHPAFLKTRACDAFAEPVACFLDADVIVTAPLDALVGQAEAGVVLASRDLQPSRWFDEWASIYGLRAPLRREPYRNAGVVVVHRGEFPDLVPRWQECGDRVARTWVSTMGPDDSVSPIWFRDQDALNALLMSEVPAGAVAPVPGVALRTGDLLSTRVVDAARLRCRRGGRPVGFLHSLAQPKPWDAAAGRSLPGNAYTRCLRRALMSDDVALRLPSAFLPPWLRRGARAGRTAR